MKSYQVPESECQMEAAGRGEERRREEARGVYEILIEWRRKR